MSRRLSPVRIPTPGILGAVTPGILGAVQGEEGSQPRAQGQEQVS